MKRSIEQKERQREQDAKKEVPLCPMCSQVQNTLKNETKKSDGLTREIDQENKLGEANTKEGEVRVFSHGTRKGSAVDLLGHAPTVARHTARVAAKQASL